jgi:hypothetical protein
MSKRTSENPDPVRNEVWAAHQVNEGEDYSAEVEGGFSIKKAPCNGFVLQCRSGYTAFVSTSFLLNTLFPRSMESLAREEAAKVTAEKGQRKLKGR